MNKDNNSNVIDVVETNDTELDDSEILTYELETYDENNVVESVNEATEVVVEEVVEPIIDNSIDMIVVREGYQVGTNFDIANGHYNNYDIAYKMANEQTKITGDIHHVYDVSGNVVFSAKKKLAILSKIHEKRGMRRC